MYQQQVKADGQCESDPQKAGLPSDEEVVRRVLAGDVASFELLMRRYNQRVFKVVRSIVGNDGEAEDIVQEAYVRAFEKLGQFAGRAKFSTWLTKIAVYEALARRRRRKLVHVFDLSDEKNVGLVPTMEDRHAEQQASLKELAAVLTRAIDGLPDDLRTVFVLRVVEELDTAEAAACLDITEANVKVRLHRARALLRQHIDAEIGAGVRQVYQFEGERCDRIVAQVAKRLASQGLRPNVPPPGGESPS